MKDYLKIIVEKSIETTYILFSLKPFKFLNYAFQRVNTIIYNKIMSLKFHGDGIRFRYPVNLIKGAEYINIGNQTSFGKLTVLTAWDKVNDETFTPLVKIGKNCNFGDYLHLTSINKIIIGDHVLTGRWVTISDNNHGNTDYETLKIVPLHRKLSSRGPVCIRNNVWIGDKVSILSGVTIGEGAVIAANTVVTKDVPPYSVAAGNPAKIIKQSLK